MKEKKKYAYEQAIAIKDGYVFVQPVCEYFGINYVNQCRVIVKDPLLDKYSIIIHCEEIFGDHHKRVALPIHSFIRWIQGIRVSTPKANLKEQFIECQEHIFDYLNEYLLIVERLKVLTEKSEKMKALESKYQSNIIDTLLGKKPKETDESLHNEYKAIMGEIS